VVEQLLGFGLGLAFQEPQRRRGRLVAADVVDVLDLHHSEKASVFFQP
jgi:hypothetical protein